MHGRIFAELQLYAEARLGPGGWLKLQQASGLGRRLYLATRSYDDADAGALVGAAVKLTGLPARRILEDFGEFIAPSMARGYRAMIKPEWTIFDLIEHVERVHDGVRNDPNATPPRLKTRRLGPEHVHVTYDSARRMCGVGIGIARGLGNVLQQPVAVTETQCMHDGAATCEFDIVRAR